MAQVLAFNNSRKARGISSTRKTYIQEQSPGEVRAKVDGLVAELLAAIDDLEKALATLNAQIVFLPATQCKLELEGRRNKIVIDIYKARRILGQF